MSLFNSLSLNKRFQLQLFIVLFVTVISLLAWISTQYNFYSDWTYGNRHSLSSDTIQLLESLEGPVQIRNYQTNDATMEKAVREILQRYQRIKQDIQYSLINLELEPDLARADGITRYGQTVIKFRKKSEIIDSLSEQNISNALLRLSRQSRPTIYFLTGHGERNPTDISALGYNNLSSQLVKQGFQLQSINLLKHSLDDIDGTLIITSPSHPVLDAEIEQIKHFITAGGNLLWLQDPGDLLGLEAIAELLQVEFISGVVMDNDQRLQSVLGLSHPAKLPILSYKLHPITENMKYFTLFMTATALYTHDSSDWQSTEILLTQESSWAEMDGLILDSKFDLEKGDTRGPLSIGLALERRHNDQTQRVVIIGDTDFVSNNNIGLGANLLFLLNSINWLSQDENLISISVNNAPDTVLDLNDSQIGIIGFSFLMLLPLLFLSTGLLIWYRRRKH